MRREIMEELLNLTMKALEKKHKSGLDEEGSERSEEIKEIEKIDEPEESVGEDTINFTYNDLQNKLEKIKGIEIITGKKFDAILCITRGGLIPSGIIAYQLGIKNIINIGVSSYSGKKQEALTLKPLSKKEIKCLNIAQNVLIVDDIVDSGKTLDAVSEYLGEKFKDLEKFFTFSIVTKNKTKNDFFVYDLTDDPRWVVFPWDI